MRQKALMMKNTLEGCVQTGTNLLLKWKTGMEDESKGHFELASLLKKHSLPVLKAAGVESTLNSHIVRPKSLEIDR